MLRPSASQLNGCGFIILQALLEDYVAGVLVNTTVSL